MYRYSDTQREVDAQFFRALSGERHDDVSIIMINHVFPGRDVYFDAIKERAHLMAIVPKGTSDNEATREEYKEKYQFLLNKEAFKNAEVVVDAILPHIKQGQKVVFMDHGGYTASILPELCDRMQQNGRSVIGVVENTQNGHDKFLREFREIQGQKRQLPVPLVSIADCELKNALEEAIGSSIVKATDVVLHSQSQTRHDLSKAFVLGYGKVGSAIAAELNSPKTEVYDTRQVALTRAHQRGFKIVSKEDRTAALGRADLIFCGGGVEAFRLEDYQHVKNGCYIVGVTSRDESLYLPVQPYEKVRDRYRELKGVYTYKNKDTEHTVYLINDGDAANFTNQQTARARR